MIEVVVTGIGIVSPLGFGRERTWHALLNGHSAVAPDKEYPGILSARVPYLDIPNETRLLSFAFLSTAEALFDSGVDLSQIPAERVGCTVSTSKLNLYSENDIIGNFLQSNLGMQLKKIFGLGGPTQNISAACATGVNSIIMGVEWIKNGKCDVVIAGAAESSFHPLYVSGFKKMGVLSSKGVKPFDKKRDGFAMGEGAAVFVLENKKSAMLRCAKIYGKIAGYAMAEDVNSSVAFSEDGDSIIQAIKNALKSSKLKKVDYINAHGTATQHNDLVETKAIKKVFGKIAYKILVSSTKAATGHLLGASGAIETAFCLLAIRENSVPPTLNLNEPDKKLDLNYVPNRSRFGEINSCMSLSFGLGGQIGVIVVTR
ncbi:MAG: beta-ketoacyl-[acyl-carrier-protein] synthase family protein [Elusimicrobia bacterium]|nr:beta-ketoacyl-[acyl-carrier-protein] synthase family protein [Elusimicrobiota bacterium]